jgi:hypothetical protein
VKGPYLTGLSDTGVEVRFDLDGASAAAIDVAPDERDAGRPRTFSDGATSAMHVVRATGLAPATSYRYFVRVGARPVAEGQFATTPTQDSGAPLKFLVYGDNRTDSVAHAAVVRALSASPSDFLVNTGDMVEDGARAEDWQSFFDIEGRLLRTRALFVAIGNHELYDDRAGANFARYFGFADQNGSVRPYGTVRLSNIRFFFLNAMDDDWSSGEERRWLEQQLGIADREPGLVWRIAVVHQGPWSSGPHGPNAPLVSAHVPELLAAHGVDLVFSGHDHIYERGDTRGMKYVISGGGGAPLYRTSKVASTRKAESTYHFVEVTTRSEGLSLVARRVDGSLLDRCGFGKGSPWDCDPPPTVSSPAPPSAPPAPATVSPGPRCSCEVPGGARGSVTGALVSVSASLGSIALASRRRRRERG